MEDRFFSSFTDEVMSIKTSAVAAEAAKATGLLQAGGKSVGQFLGNIRKGWKGEGLRGVTGESSKVGKGIGGAYQHAKHGLQQAWKDPAARRGLKAAGGAAAVAGGLGGAGYMHGRLSSPNVTINRGY